MGIICQLPKELIEKIAAGEVVERPSSVVKELVENAIDAGATGITIDIEDGGKKRIAVIDDGCGMGEGDLKLCVLRHATSKIAQEQDLWNIRTMGFRGEALAAIGAVSSLELESKLNSRDVIEGARITVDGGVAGGPVSAGCPGGTKVVVSDLFFNVPARLKFLRSGAVEGGHVFDVVANLALAFPEIRFEFSADGKRRFISGSGNLAERIADVIGEDVRGRLISFEEMGDDIAVRGWLARGGRSGGKDVFFFVNSRPVRDKILMHALTQGFGELLSRGEYPVAAVWLGIDPAKVDVNVHPTKREVRFAEGKAVHDFVMASVRKAVARCFQDQFRETTNEAGSTKQEAGNTMQEAGSMMQEAGSMMQEAGNMKHDQTSLSCFMPHASCVEPHAPCFMPPASCFKPHASCFMPPASDRFEQLAVREMELKPLGQLGLTYAVCEGADGELVLIDQHAAHERLRFDTLKRQYSEGRVAGQRLLIPERVELGEKALAYVSEHAELFARAGFEIEPFGGGTLLVKSIPAVMGAPSVASLFDKIASELEDFGGSSSHDEEIERIFATVACHSQVRAGDKLSNEELGALIRDIEREGVTHCPHGRPAIVRIERGEIEKWFKRRQ